MQKKTSECSTACQLVRTRFDRLLRTTGRNEWWGKGE